MNKLQAQFCFAVNAKLVKHILKIGFDGCDGNPHLKGDLLVRLQELGAVADFMRPGGRDRANRGHMRDVQQRRYLTKDGAGLRNTVDLKIAFNDFDLALGQDVQSPRLVAFGQKDFAGPETADRNVPTKV